MTFHTDGAAYAVKSVAKTLTTLPKGFAKRFICHRRYLRKVPAIERLRTDREDEQYQGMWGSSNRQRKIRG